MTRYPIAPLLDACGVHNVHQLYERCGLQLWGYTHTGLTPDHADRVAVRAGLHPAMVWDTWIDDALTPLDRLFLEQGWRQAWLHREAA